MEKYTQEDKERIVREMLIVIGEDPNREGLIDTPKRIVKMWKEIFRGYDDSQKPKVTTFMNSEDKIEYNQMVNDSGDFYSQCEHHQLPFFGKYYFAYIPNPKGKILGLSKVARVVDYFSARMQIQERLVGDIVNYLWDELILIKNGKKIEPLGIALVMDGEHLCKTMRGARKKGIMRSCELRGAFKNDSATRNEFMMWVNK